MAISIPSSPSNGQTFSYNGVTYTYSSSRNSWSTSPASTGGTPRLDIISEDGYWTVPIGVTSIIVHVISGGAGGGQNNSNGYSAGVAGYGVAYINNLVPGTSIAVTVGAGGSGGRSSTNGSSGITGGTGGTTSFGTYVTVTGGTGGGVLPRVSGSPTYSSSGGVVVTPLSKNSSSSFRPYLAEYPSVTSGSPGLWGGGGGGGGYDSCGGGAAPGGDGGVTQVGGLASGSNGTAGVSSGYGGNGGAGGGSKGGAGGTGYSSGYAGSPGTGYGGGGTGGVVIEWIGGNSGSSTDSYYTGSDSTNTSYPIGSYLFVGVSNWSPASIETLYGPNKTVVVKAASVSSYTYITAETGASVTGTALSGTWKIRSSYIQISCVLGWHAQQMLVQRVA